MSSKDIKVSENSNECLNKTCKKVIRYLVSKIVLTSNFVCKHEAQEVFVLQNLLVYYTVLLFVFELCNCALVATKYIHYDSKVLVPVVYLAEPVETSLWVVLVKSIKQSTLNFLPRPARKKTNVPLSQWKMDGNKPKLD